MTEEQAERTLKWRLHGLPADTRQYVIQAFAAFLDAESVYVSPPGNHARHLESMKRLNATLQHIDRQQVRAIFGDLERDIRNTEAFVESLNK